MDRPSKQGRNGGCNAELPVHHCTVLLLQCDDDDALLFVALHFEIIGSAFLGSILLLCLIAAKSTCTFACFVLLD